ncbi:ATP-binding protein [Streptomyces sp. NBC_00076]|uniref:sensor histidine kinase n=1 Tax=Streptomyces sp. NBC_00076 TaxID=2975642 RepID=UPI00324DE4B2
MSHLRAPAARADRREGGRHGRPAARAVPALPETHIRPQLLRLAVLPPVAAALSGCAAVLFTVRSTGARPSLPLWGVLGGAVSVTCVGILVAAVAADRAARSVSDRIGALRRSSARGEADLRALVDTLRRGEAPPSRNPRGGPPEDADDFELLAADLTRAHDGAVTAVVQAAQLSSQAGSEQKLEVFLNLARRLQSLVHREISILDELENEIEDPDLLKGLFHVDHLATRIRRHAENLAVLGGAVSRRQWSNPVSMTEVLRSAIAEVEQYSRVKLVPPIDGELRGHAVADVIHLLAELVENATVFSAPHTQVLLRANLVTSGLAVEVEDRGLGMPVGEQSRMNALLADPDQVNVASLLADGRIGLFVVSQLAKRHGIHVRLQTNIYGGVQAVLVVPQALLGAAPGALGAVPQPPDGRPVSTGPAGPAMPPRQTGPEGTYREVPVARGGASPAPPSLPSAGQRPQQSASAGERGAGRTMGAGSASTSVSGSASGAASGTASSLGGAPGAASGPGTRTGAGADSAAGAGGGGGSVPGSVPVPVPGSGSGSSWNGGGPAPLPVRGARRGRHTPAEAVPGIRPEDRPLVAEHTAAPPTPRAGAVRGTMGKPQLPRRRAQEHIAPQLRDGPAPRQDSEDSAGHDPGLMAAFQRGIGLAEAQQHLKAAPDDTTTSMASTHTASTHTASTHTASTHTAPTHTAPTHTAPTNMGPVDTASPYTTSPYTTSIHTASPHRASTHTGPVDTGTAHMAPTDRRLTDEGLTEVELTGVGLTRIEPSGMAPSDMSDRVPSDTSSPDRWASGTRSPDMDFGHTGPADGVSSYHADATDMTPAPSMDVRPLHPLPTDQARIAEARYPHAPAYREARAARGSGDVPGHDLDLDHRTRHDGSAPAG